MLKIAIPTHVLKAAINCAANKDVRYYLNGVHVRVEEDGSTYIESTDGSMVFQDQLIHLYTEQKGSFSIIIPLDAVNSAVKEKTLELVLQALDGGRYSLGNVMFTALDGRFPDLERIVPSKDEYFGPAPTFNADLLATCQKALREATLHKNGVFRLFGKYDGGSMAAPTMLMAPRGATFPRCVIAGYVASKTVDSRKV